MFDQYIVNEYDLPVSIIFQSVCRKMVYVNILRKNDLVEYLKNKINYILDNGHHNGHHNEYCNEDEKINHCVTNKSIESIIKAEGLEIKVGIYKLLHLTIVPCSKWGSKYNQNSLYKWEDIVYTTEPLVNLLH